MKVSTIALLAAIAAPGALGLRHHANIRGARDDENHDARELNSKQGGSKAGNRINGIVSGGPMDENKSGGNFQADKASRIGVTLDAKKVLHEESVYQKWLDEVQPLLDEALSQHSDGAISSVSSVASPVDKYINQNNLIIPSETPELSNIIEHGSRTESPYDIKSTISHLTLSCMCYDSDCRKPVAVDLKGAKQEGRGHYRGRTPLLLVDKDNNPQPCLSTQALPIDDIKVQGCTYIRYSNNVLHVKDCVDQLVENLRIYRNSTGELIARALSPLELMPNSADASIPPKAPVVDIITAAELQPISISERIEIPIKVDIPEIGPFEVGPLDIGPQDVGPFTFGPYKIGPYKAGPYEIWPFTIGPFNVGPYYAGPFEEGPFTIGPFSEGPFEIGPFEIEPFDEVVTYDLNVNVTDTLAKTSKAMLAGALDTIGMTLLPTDFKETRPLSNATVPELLRVQKAYSVDRLQHSTVFLNNRESLLTRSTPTYADLVSTKPQTSTLAEIVSGDVTSSFAAFFFGWTAASIFFCPKEFFNYLMGLIGSALGLAAELFAFSSRWMAENDLKEWKRSLLIVKTVASSEPDILGLTVGRDSDMLSITVMTAELTSNENQNARFAWLYVGLAFVVFLLVVGTCIGIYQQKKEQKKKQKEEKSQQQGSEHLGQQYNMKNAAAAAAAAANVNKVAVEAPPPKSADDHTGPNNCIDGQVNNKDASSHSSDSSTVSADHTEPTLPLRNRSDDPSDSSPEHGHESS